MNLNLNVECNGVYSWHMLLKINSVFLVNSHYRILLWATLIIAYSLGQLQLSFIVITLWNGIYCIALAF